MGWRTSTDCLCCVPPAVAQDPLNLSSTVEYATVSSTLHQLRAEYAHADRVLLATLQRAANNMGGGGERQRMHTESLPQASSDMSAVAIVTELLQVMMRLWQQRSSTHDTTTAIPMFPFRGGAATQQAFLVIGTSCARLLLC